MQAQLVETAILNIINHQSLIATKASRIVHCRTKRRRHGIRTPPGPGAGRGYLRCESGYDRRVHRNLQRLCGQMFNVPVKGTHAHSWIMSFPDELTAFRTYAKLYPSACILLVDTYDTLKSGVPTRSRSLRKCGKPAFR